jgi:hypothetical protein
MFLDKARQLKANRDSILLAMLLQYIGILDAIMSGKADELSQEHADLLERQEREHLEWLAPIISSPNNRPVGVLLERISALMYEAGYTDEERADQRELLSKHKVGRVRHRHKEKSDETALRETVRALELSHNGKTFNQIADELCPNHKHPHKGDWTEGKQNSCANRYQKAVAKLQAFLDRWGYVVEPRAE